MRLDNRKKKVIAVLSDLMFTVKIQEAAKRAGLDAVFVKSHDDALGQAKQKPAVIILDLNNTAVDPLDVIETLKSDQDTRGIDLVGFVSHVQADLKKAALEKGCDVVIARSAFSQNLPAILRRYA
ncbi:MAG TPA: response regulator [Bryobacteraceae bacterium]